MPPAGQRNGRYRKFTLATGKLMGTRYLNRLMLVYKQDSRVKKQRWKMRERNIYQKLLVGSQREVLNSQFSFFVNADIGQVVL